MKESSSENGNLFLFRQVKLLMKLCNIFDLTQMNFNSFKILFAITIIFIEPL